MTAEAAANAEPSLACERRHRAYVVIRARQLHTGGELEPAHAAVAAAQVASAFTRAAGWRRHTCTRRRRAPRSAGRRMLRERETRGRAQPCASVTVSQSVFAAGERRERVELSTAAYMGRLLRTLDGNPICIKGATVGCSLSEGGPGMCSCSSCFRWSPSPATV